MIVVRLGVVRPPSRTAGVCMGGLSKQYLLYYHHRGHHSDAVVKINMESAP